MGKAYLWAAAYAAAFGLVSGASAETLTIATVNNSDMIIMQKLAPKWEQATGNKLNWVVLEENVLLQRVTTAIATNSGASAIPPLRASATPFCATPARLAAT